jgi:hypothetical protein
MTEIDELDYTDKQWKCVVCDKPSHADGDGAYIVPTKGITCEDCMTAEDHELWDKANQANQKD